MNCQLPDDGVAFRRRRWRSAHLVDALMLLLTVASILGCEPQPSTIGQKTSQQFAAAEETSFEQQLHEVIEGRADSISVRSAVISDADLHDIAAAKGLRRLSIEQSSASDEGVVMLGALPRLTHLKLRGVRVGDEGVRALAGLSGLRAVNLPQADFSDAALADLAGLPDLELLRFGSPRVTDEGMKTIASMKTLRFLHMIGVPLTAKGLKELAAMKQLESLYLDDIDLPNAALSELHEALPDLHFHDNQGHRDR